MPSLHHRLLFTLWYGLTDVNQVGPGHRGDGQRDAAPEPFMGADEGEEELAERPAPPVAAGGDRDSVREPVGAGPPSRPLVLGASHEMPGAQATDLLLQLLQLGDVGGGDAPVGPLSSRISPYLPERPCRSRYGAAPAVPFPAWVRGVEAAKARKPDAERAGVLGGT